MNWLFFFLPLGFMLPVTFYMNIKKRTESQLRIACISVLESIICFSFVAVLFLSRIDVPFFIYSILLVLTLTSGLILFWNNNDIKQETADIEQDQDVQFETMKNVIVLFLITILPFYIGLTIFRHLSIILAMVLSFILSSLTTILHHYLTKAIEPIYQKTALKVSISGPSKWLMLLVPAFILLITLFFIDFRQIPLNDFFYIGIKPGEIETLTLSLPLYSSFNILHVLSIILALFIPITNYRKLITIIDWAHYVYQKYK